MSALAMMESNQSRISSADCGWDAVPERPHILVVDDENGPRQSLRMLLNEQYDVTIADNVDSAVEVVKTQPVDLIITDLRMPQKTGVDLLRDVKAIQPEVQVIILTGYGHLETAMEAVQHDAFAYMEKPFDNEEMLEKVRLGVVKHRAELDRRTMEQLALEANRFATVGRIVSGMMHDLGTPLTVIANQIELMMIRPENDDVARRLDTMQSQVRHCNDIVRTTMNFLRHDTVENQKFCVNDVVEMCLEVGRPLLRGEKVSVATDMSGNSPLCQGDVVLLRQAILNLVTNACQAMKPSAEKKEMNIITWVEDEMACISVEDSGPGVPQEYQSKIFETFFTTKKNKGTGLGLAVIKNAMHRFNGTINLVQEEGRGAKFVIRIPLAECS